MLLGILNSNILCCWPAKICLYTQVVLMWIYDDCLGTDLMFPTSRDLIRVV